MLIPARGGSKRLPGKCLLDVGGVTLLGRAIATARRAACLLNCSARIVVSTDEPRYADHARASGAEVPFMRPPALATDDAPTVAVIRHALEHFAGCGETFDRVALLQPTSPLRAPEDVVQSIQSHQRTPSAPAVTVRPGDDGSALTQFRLRDGILRRANAKGDPVVLSGAVYVFTPAWIRENDALALPDVTRAVLMPAERSVDVDTADDLARAAALWGAQSPWPAGRCLIIAEAGVNHDGDREVARRLIDAAKAAGADAVKFQTFTASRMAVATAPKAAYQQRTTSSAESQLGMLSRLALDADAHRALRAYCAEIGITFLSSAFGEPDVDLLDALDVPLLKLGSGELTNHPLLAHAAATLRPIICSTGAAHLSEVVDAVRVLRTHGCDHLALLHCVSEYPAPCRELNLRAIQTLARTFHVPVGFSDHTLSIEAACAAVALGAAIIEKHLTLDRNRRGPDHRASLEPQEFAALVKAVRNVESALGDGCKRPMPCEASVREAARRSLVTTRPIAAGTELRREHLTAKRPGSGIVPHAMALVLGRRVLRDLAPDEILTWTDLGPIGNPT